MWTPVNIDAIPSVKDKFHAIKAISAVEEELRDALLALERAQHLVDSLEKDLRERRAWIAPIRRLPYEILSHIFEFCGEEEWESIFDIAAVSRFWREVSLSTSRAWSFIPFGYIYYSSAALNLVLERSGQRLLHGYLPSYTSDTFATNIAQKLICLSTEIIPPDCGDIFPSLQRLVIRGNNKPIDASAVTNARFPALRHLVCIPSIVAPSANLSEGAASPITADNFWPLESLSIPMAEEPTWFLILKRCAETLVSLGLSSCRETGEHAPDPPLALRLPMLKSLAINCQDADWEDGIIWPLDLQTPALEIYSYSEILSGHDPVVMPHRDIGSVLHMRTDQNVPLSLVPQLRVLEIPSPKSMTNFLAQLAIDASLCPKLELIETRATIGIKEAGAVVTELNKLRKLPIKFSHVLEWKGDPPGTISRSVCTNRLTVYLLLIKAKVRKGYAMPLWGGLHGGFDSDYRVIKTDSNILVVVTVPGMEDEANAEVRRRPDGKERAAIDVHLSYFWSNVYD